MSKRTNILLDPQHSMQEHAVPGSSFGALVRRDWKFVAIITAVITAIAWLLAISQPQRYRASTLAAIAPIAEGLTPDEVLRGVEVLERRTIVATVAALAATPVTRAQAQTEDGYVIEAAVLPNTNLFRVDVEGRGAAQAAAIANRVPRSLDAQTRAMFKYYGVSQVSTATQPENAFFPRPGRAVAAGFIIGLFVGLLAAYVRNASNPRFARRA